MKLGLFWGIAVMLSPFVILFQENIDVREHQNIFFWFASSASIFFYGTKNVYKVLPATLLCGVFVVLSFLTQVSIDATSFPYVISQYISIILGSILTIQLISNFKKQDGDIVIWFIGLVCFAESFWIILNSLGVDPYQIILSLFKNTYSAKFLSNEEWISSIGKSVPVAGSLLQNTLSGALVAISLPGLFTPMTIPLLAFPIYALYLCKSAMAWGTFIVVILGYLCTYYKVKLKLILPLVTGALMISAVLINTTKFFSDSERFFAWKAILNIHNMENTVNLRVLKYKRSLEAYGSKELPEMIEIKKIQGEREFYKNLIIGGGPGWLESVGLRIGLVQWLPSHNEYLEVFNVFGVIGITSIFLFATWLLFNFKMFYENPKYSAIFFGIMANSFGNFPWHISPIAILGIVSLAIILSNQGEKNGTISFV